MMKKTLPLLASALILGIVVSLVSFGSANAEGTVVDHPPTISPYGLLAQVAVTGTLSAEDKRQIATADYMFFEYGPYEEGMTEISITGRGKCTLLGKNNNFTCTASGLGVGSYAYSVGRLADVTSARGDIIDVKQVPFFTGYRPFYITSDFAGKTTVDFGSAVVSGRDATITVDVKHLLVQAEGYFQLGIASQVGSTSNYICIPGSKSSPAIPVRATVGDTPETIAYTFPNLDDGNYCVRVQAKFPGVGLQNVGNPNAVDENGYFKGKNTLFSIGAATLVVGATNDPSTNPSGCVTKDDNSNYCMLAPLPGLGDGSGDLDVTKGIGDYFLTIIQIVMGAIGVLSVLMLIVGGIEYMSTVSVGEKEGARSRIEHALLGLLLALSSYVILRTLNPKLVDLGVTIPTAQLEIDGDEGSEESSVPPPATLPSVSGITVPTGTATELAKKILANANVRFTVLKDEPRATPRQNIQDVADGKLAWTSVRGDVGSRQTTLSEQMLGGILAAASKTSFTITEIAGGDHGKTSAHYVGRAIDISATSGDLGRNTAIMNACLASGAKWSQIFGPCNNVYLSNGKFNECKATKYLTNSDHQTHIHCGW